MLTNKIFNASALSQLYIKLYLTAIILTFDSKQK